MKRWFALLLTAVMLISTCLNVSAAQPGVLALGADLNEEQKTAVISAMGISADEAASYQTIYITNDMEHEYLDASLGADVVGKRSLSSVLVLPQESGAGLDVETHNINYCTISMYRNALLTAGVSDAKVIVAAPSPISGTAALIGAVKAYEAYSGEQVSEEAFSVATDELVLTGELMDELENADADKVSELVAYLKQYIAEHGLDDPQKLGEVVRQTAAEMNLELSDEQVTKIVDLLLKLNKLEIDPGKLVDQAKELYNKLDELGIEIDREKVGNFITRFIASVWELIQSFIKK